MRRAALVLVAALGGCGSDDTGSGGATSTASSSATGDGGAGGDPTPPESCVQAGEPGNDIGVGKYCTPLGGECVGTAPLCLAAAAADEKQWFCSKLGCEMNEECGADAVCLTSEAVPACVPAKCFEGSGGAGSGGGTGGIAGSGGAPGGAGGEGGK